MKYKRGDLPTYQLKEVEELAIEGIERVIGEKMAAIRRLTEVIA